MIFPISDRCRPAGAGHQPPATSHQPPATSQGRYQVSSEVEGTLSVTSAPASLPAFLMLSVRKVHGGAS